MSRYAIGARGRACAYGDVVVALAEAQGQVAQGLSAGLGAHGLVVREAVVLQMHSRSNRNQVQFNGPTCMQISHTWELNVSRTLMQARP